jgi:putative transposase
MKINREKLKIVIGGYFIYENETFKITQLIDSHEVIGINVKNNDVRRLLIEQLKAVQEKNIKNNGYIYKDKDDFSDDDWATMEQRLMCIQPLINGATREEIEEHAKELNVHFTTLYRWLRGYKSTGSVTGLLSQKRGRKKGTVFIEQDIEKIIQNVIETDYLTIHKPSIKSVINKVKIKCIENNLTFPSNNTIRNRISKLSQYQILKQQGNKALANDTYKPAPNKYSADYPLQVVQIDHTKVDLIILDDKYRKPIGRPWLTLAIDVYSRMIVGYYLSLEAPSGTSVGMCLVNSILPKNKLLNDFDIDAEWNVWGKMDNIDSDNGADFRSYAVEKSCLINNIHLKFRPIGKKEYGGHIERLIGTTMKEVHDIPGTTFSNIADKLTYDSESNACLTFSDFEKWLLLYITKIYQHNIHSSIMTSPAEKWRQGIFGTKDNVGIGYPQIPADPTSLTIDFFPTIERTIQKNGVTIDGINYFDPVLKGKIRGLERMQLESDKNSSNKKYIFKRDPRNISQIWFYDDYQQEYYLIPLANPEIPKMSLFELHMIKKEIETSRNQVLNEYNIIQGYKELYQHIESSIKKTKKQRRHLQKVQNNKNKSNVNLNKVEVKSRAIDSSTEDSIWEQDIPDFG